jgi:protein-disulfide isomerase
MDTSQNDNGKKFKSLLPVTITALAALTIGGVLFGVSQASTQEPEGRNTPVPSASTSASVTSPAGLTAKGGYLVPSAEVKENAPEVVVYLDFLCPACQQFENAYSASLLKQAADGAISLEYRPISILDRASTTFYSSRAMNSFACVADSKPDAALAYINKLMEAQPQERGPGLTDDELASHAASVGAGEVKPCITGKNFRDWVNTTSDNALNSGLTHTPYVVINGEAWDGNTDLLQALTSAGMASADQ